MSSISSVGGNSSMMMQGMQGMRGMKRPDPAEMAENLFSKLDTSGQGYIEKVDLQSAFDKVSSNTNTSSFTSSVDDMFSQLDTDSNGKVTKEEFTSSLKKLSDELDQQFQSGRMQEAMQMGGMGEGMGGMPPPGGMPPGGNGGGMTKDQLTSAAKEIGSSDSTASSSLTNLVNNFDEADADGDGKVSFQEAMAYQQSSSSTSGTTATSSISSTPSTGTTTASSSASDTEAKVKMQIMKLMHAYMADNSSALSSTLSVSA
jgi:Ca2+-binding EF-hand superfamily protein